MVKSDTDGLIEQFSKDGVGRAVFGAIIGSLALWDEDHSGSLALSAVDSGCGRGE